MKQTILKAILWLPTLGVLFAQAGLILINVGAVAGLVFLLKWFVSNNPFTDRI